MRLGKITLFVDSHLQLNIGSRITHQYICPYQHPELTFLISSFTTSYWHLLNLVRNPFIGQQPRFSGFKAQASTHVHTYLQSLSFQPQALLNHIGYSNLVRLLILLIHHACSEMTSNCASIHMDTFMSRTSLLLALLIYFGSSNLLRLLIKLILSSYLMIGLIAHSFEYPEVCVRLSFQICNFTNQV